MTILLAFIGILNTLLIQVHSRARELSILTTLGVDRVGDAETREVRGVVAILDPHLRGAQVPGIAAAAGTEFTKKVNV